MSNSSPSRFAWVFALVLVLSAAARTVRAEDEQGSPPPAPATKAYSIVPGLGTTWVTYQETGKTQFDETVLTAKISFNYALSPPRWDAGANFFITALPLSTSQSGITARFIGLNLRVGYVVPFLEDPWRLSLMGGVYYTTMSVTNSLFGYKDLLYPQFLPGLSYAVDPRNSVRAYIKFVPTTSGFSIYSSTERELAVGFGYEHKMDGHSLALTLDWADLKYLPTATTSIESRTTTLGLAYGL